MKTAADSPVADSPVADSPVDIWILVFPGFLLLDATGPIQVFASANDEASDAGLPAPYRILLVAPGGGVIPSAAGVGMVAAPLPLPRHAIGGTLIVAGGADASLPSRDTDDGAALLSWVAEMSENVARCCSVCTGAFVLARAGLLAGRRAVTHWMDVPALREQHPAVDVEEDAIHVRDGKFHTSAGISAGMDLALSLVEEDLGRAAALAVARRMVLFLKRSGGQRQFSSELLAQSQPEGVAAGLIAWLSGRLTQEIGVEQMAEACALSVRTLHRKLLLETNSTPAQLLARLRIEHACGLLEQQYVSLKEVARQSGYGTEYNLRRAFKQRLGVLPSDYRARFA